MSDKVQEWVFGAKCRHCDHKNIWHFGGSGNISSVAFIDAMQEKLKTGTVKECEECCVLTIHDVTFYGAQEDYQELIDKMLNKKF